MSNPLPTRDIAHLRAHLGVRLERLAADKVRGVLELGSRARTRDGQVSLGALATVVDVAALFTAKASNPAPQVTSHLALRLPLAPADGRLHTDSSVVRSGRSGVVSLVHVTDDTGRIVGVATVTSGALAGAGGSHQPDFQRPDDDFYEPSRLPGDGPPIDEFLAMSPAGPGRYRMAFHETLRNVNGVLHGGGGALVIEQAARHGIADAGGRGAVVDSLDVHFVAPGLVGPFLASVEVVGDGPGPRSAVIEVVDEGRAGRLVVMGMVGCHGG